MRGETLWKAKRGPKAVSLEQCDLGKGPGVVKGAYASLPGEYMSFGVGMVFDAAGREAVVAQLAMIEEVLEPATPEESAGSSSGEPAGEKDPLYDQAVEIVVRTRRPSISLVQRHLRIGYNRAARLIEDMERAGMVSAMQSNGNREVLVPAKAE